MSLTPGTRIGPYEITGALGAGGMGEVYRARDTRLNRDAAIKVLPAAVAEDAEGVARLRREAQVLAALSHPHIAAIYGLEEAEEVLALALEFVEGDDLAARLARGPLPLDEALDYARQIADGLDAAHEKGIVHRDLKPANIKVTPDGVVKILDFGLAKPDAAAAARSGSDPAQSPTITAHGTAAGVILGTAAYMSPEQARGRAVDKRADVWAFGVVLFEMLTGRRLFSGESLSDTLAAVLTREPDWAGLPPATPPRVKRLLARCLERDPKKRLRDIGDARLELDAHPDSAGAAPAPRARGHLLPWILVGLLAVAVAVLLWSPWRSIDTVSAPLMRFTVEAGLTPALSPDGRRVVYRTTKPGGSGSILATRLLGESAATLLSGTEGGYNPFFSPDGQWIAFFDGRRLLKIPASGGAPVVLCDAPSGRGGHWGDDGTLVAELTPFSGLWKVNPQGGPPVQLTRPSLDRHAWPHVLPGGRGVLYSAAPEGLLEHGRIEAIPVGGGEPRVLIRGGYGARFIPDDATAGYLVYLHAGVLYAVGFNPERLRVEGEPVQIVDDVGASGMQMTAAIGESRAGIFVYRTGTSRLTWPLAWLDHEGRMEQLPAPAGAYYTPRVSPDGHRIALAVDSARGQDIFVYDIATNAMTRVTTTGSGNLWPVWTPDGRHLLFTARTAAGGSIWWARSDGSRQPVELFKGRHSIRQIALSPDARTLVYTEQNPESSSDLWLLPLDLGDPDRPGAGEAKVLRKTGAAEGAPAFSPDGRWIAYVSDELGPWEVWVQPFPSLTGRWQVSSGDGGYISWSRHALELYYGGTSRTRVEYATDGDRFLPGKRTRLEAVLLPTTPIGLDNVDLAPDGRRFLVLGGIAQRETEAPRVTFLLNFTDELRRRTGR